MFFCVKQYLIYLFTFYAHSFLYLFHIFLHSFIIKLSLFSFLNSLINSGGYNGLCLKTTKFDSFSSEIQKEHDLLEHLCFVSFSFNIDAHIGHLYSCKFDHVIDIGLFEPKLRFKTY